MKSEIRNLSLPAVSLRGACSSLGCAGAAAMSAICRGTIVLLAIALVGAGLAATSAAKAADGPMSPGDSYQQSVGIDPAMTAGPGRATGEAPLDLRSVVGRGELFGSGVTGGIALQQEPVLGVSEWCMASVSAPASARPSIDPQPRLFQVSCLLLVDAVGKPGAGRESSRGSSRVAATVGACVGFGVGTWRVIQSPREPFLGLEGEIAPIGTIGLGTAAGWLVGKVWSILVD